jgi:hypothetical protein
MSSAYAKATTRMVVASFAAGAGAMVLLGLVAPIAMHGGLAVRDAFAAEVTQEAPAIEPLDVVAIQAQLAAADRQMGEMRADTADEMSRLERLSR